MYDGLDEAIIGVDMRTGNIIYDFALIIEILSKNMTYDEAREYADFNIINMYVGERTPVIMYKEDK